MNRRRFSIRRTPRSLSRDQACRTAVASCIMSSIIWAIRRTPFFSPAIKRSIRSAARSATAQRPLLDFWPAGASECAHPAYRWLFFTQGFRTPLSVENTADTVKGVFVAMGEPKSSMFLVQKLRDYLAIEAYAPKEGDKVNLEC